MSRRALSMQAYLAYARSVTLTDPASPWPDRPQGPLVWTHAATLAQGRALASLCARLRTQRPEISILASGHVPDRSDLTWIALPPDSPQACDRFVAHIRPAVALWTGQDLRPALIDSLARHGTHLIGLDADDQSWATPAPRWMPDPAAAVLAMFDMLHTKNAGGSRKLRRLGVSSTQIKRSGPLMDTDLPLTCPDALHEEVAQLLTGRPIWLAAHLRASETHDILTAHRRALRLAHRLLLILTPFDPSEAEQIKQAASAAQLRICDWENGDMPDENTQVLVTEDTSEMGLWYRLAPLAFLGDSLVPGHGGHDPFAAATLGTGILYGPNVGNHLGAYSQLVEAGAARIVRDADTLASAVSNLAAPDQAATMAHAGWDVISSGAALVDRIIHDIDSHIDESESA